MKIVVIGSINTDLVTIANSFPQIGETIIGNDFSLLPGGKGANQAVCAAKLGAEVHFVGCVGDDSNGVASLENLKNNNVSVDNVETIPGVPSGIASITIAENDNSIIIVKGANDEVSIDYMKKHIDVLDGANLVMLQLEIPISTVEFVASECKRRGITTVLNPAPAMRLSKELVENVDICTPNEIECEQIFSLEYSEAIKKYPNKLIVTRGENGVVYYDGNETVNIPSQKVEVVDTTGAGDAFNGALAYGIVTNMKLADSIAFANKVAAETVKKLGAQSAMPNKEDLL